MWVGGSITYLHCEMSTQHVLSGLCPCPCLLGSLCHLLAPTVLPSSLPAPVCLSSGLLSAFWSLLCLMHIELELSRNLYPPGDTGVQMCCVNLQLLCASIRDLRVVIYMVSRAPPRDTQGFNRKAPMVPKALSHNVGASPWHHTCYGPFPCFPVYLMSYPSFQIRLK